MWVALSWVAVIVGLFATWLSARHPYGWLVSALCCVLWIMYNATISVWSGLASGILGVIINLRNYWVCRRRR